MKKLLVVSALAATSTVASAFDYKINLEGRADFVNDSAKTTAQSGVVSTDKYNSFVANYVRLNLMGSINDSLSYRLRYRITTPSANAVRETASNTVDMMYVDHKNSFFTTRFGKQLWSEAAGRESFVSGSDVFLTSSAYSAYNTAVGNYRYGVSAMKTLDGVGSFVVALSNPNATFSDSTVDASRKNNSIAYAASYTGSFADKMVQPVLSYTSAAQDVNTELSPTVKKVNYTLMSAGLRSEVAGAVIDADWKSFKKPNSNGTATTVANKEQKTTSVYVNAAYAIGDFTPMVTYINDKFTNEDATTAASANYKKNSFAVGTYFKPMADVNFRYHLMYTSAVTKYEGTVATNSKVDDKKIYFGFKADI